MFSAALTRHKHTKPSGFPPSHRGMQGLLGGERLQDLLGGEKDHSYIMAAHVLQQLNHQLGDLRRQLADLQGELLKTESQRAIAVANWSKDQDRLTLLSAGYEALQNKFETTKTELATEKNRLAEKERGYKSQGETIASLKYHIYLMSQQAEQQATAMALQHQAHIDELTGRDAEDRQKRATDLNAQRLRLHKFQSLKTEKEQLATQLARQAEAHAAELAEKDKQLKAQEHAHARFVQELIHQFSLTQQN